MTTQRQLQERQQELMEELEALEAAIAEITGNTQPVQATQQKQVAWLHRQHAGVLVLLNDTERMLLGCDQNVDDD